MVRHGWCDLLGVSGFKDNTYRCTPWPKVVDRKFFKNVSFTDLALTDDQLKRFCCPGLHASEDCCATSYLIKSLEKLGEFGSLVAVHVLAQHAWKHRVLYAMAEEGIESLHSSVKKDFGNVSRSDGLERARITIQGNGVQVQLADLDKSSE